MSDGPQTNPKPDIRQLPQVMNLFLRRAMPRFTIETCSEAFILTMTKLVPIQVLFGYVWEPARQPSHRTRLTLQNGQVLHEQEPAPAAETVQCEASAESTDDLKLVLHYSLKTLQFDPAERKTLEDQGCRAAVEIHFAYYSRPIVRVILGFSNSRHLPTVEAQEFFLVFCRCCLISLQGAYLAELDEREGRRERPELNERFSLTLQWFHSLVRHLNMGITGLQSRKTAEVEDALNRASIVAGICLAEMLALMGTLQRRPTLEAGEPPR